MQDRGPRRARRGLRPAGARAHRPRRDERRCRALQGGQEGRHQADRRLRDLLRRRPHGHDAAQGAQPPDAGGRVRRGLPQPRQAQLAGLPRGPQPRQADARHGPARRPQRRDHRADRLPGLALRQPHHRRRRGRRARPRRRAAGGVRPRQRLLRGPEERPVAAGEGQRGGRPDRARGRPAAGRHGRRALPAPRGLPPPHGAAVRADEVDARRAEDDLLDERVLPEEQRRDGHGLRGVAGGDAVHARHRRALQRRDRARQAADPALPRRRARTSAPTCASA